MYSKKARQIDLALQDLKEYSPDKYNMLDNLKDKKGNTIDVYISVEDHLNGDKSYGQTIINYVGTDIQGYKIDIKLNSILGDNMGSTMAHEAGHAYFGVTYPEAALKWRHAPMDRNNPNEQFAVGWETEHYQNKKRYSAAKK